MSHLRHNQRSAPRRWHNMTYATWRGLHFAPPCGLFRCAVFVDSIFLVQTIGGRALTIRLGKVDVVIIITFSLTFAVILTLKRWTDECHNLFIFSLTSHIRGLFLNLFETPANSIPTKDQYIRSLILSSAQTVQNIFWCTAQHARHPRTLMHFKQL